MSLHSLSSCGTQLQQRARAIFVPSSQECYSDGLLASLARRRTYESFRRLTLNTILWTTRKMALGISRAGTHVAQKCQQKR